MHIGIIIVDNEKFAEKIHGELGMGTSFRVLAKHFSLLYKNHYTWDVGCINTMSIDSVFSANVSSLHCGEFSGCFPMKDYYAIVIRLYDDCGNDTSPEGLSELFETDFNFRPNSKYPSEKSRSIVASAIFGEVSDFHNWNMVEHERSASSRTLWKAGLAWRFFTDRDKAFPINGGLFCRYYVFRKVSLGLVNIGFTPIAVNDIFNPSSGVGGFSIGYSPAVAFDLQPRRNIFPLTMSFETGLGIQHQFGDLREFPVLAPFISYTSEYTIYKTKYPVIIGPSCQLNWLAKGNMFNVIQILPEGLVWAELGIKVGFMVRRKDKEK